VPAADRDARRVRAARVPFAPGHPAPDVSDTLLRGSVLLLERLPAKAAPVELVVSIAAAAGYKKLSWRPKVVSEPHPLHCVTHSDGDSDGSAGDDDGLIGLAALDQLNPAATQAGGGEASHADTAAGSGPGGGDRSAAGDHGSGSGSASSSGAGAPRNDAARKLQQQREAMDRLSSSRRVRFDRRAPQAAPPELEPDLDEDAAELETLVDIQTAAELMAATHGGLPDSVLLRAAAAGVNLAAGTPSGSVRYAYRASRAQQPEPELNERAQATTMNRVASVTGARGGTTGMDPGSRQAAPPAAAASGSGRLGQFMPRPTAQGVSAPPLAR
jgi:hypothetical protein